jgi:hypothetical protein
MRPYVALCGSMHRGFPLGPLGRPLGSYSTHLGHLVARGWLGGAAVSTSPFRKYRFRGIRNLNP